jgi:Na+-driven multidrug efflux pump
MKLRKMETVAAASFSCTLAINLINCYCGTGQTKWVFYLMFSMYSLLRLELMVTTFMLTRPKFTAREKKPQNSKKRRKRSDFFATM